MTLHPAPPTTTTTTPHTSGLDRTVLMRLAATEYDRGVALLTGLDPADWARPTDCAGWDVRAMAGHTLGMAEMAASVREGLRQQRAAAKRGGVMIDALTALQVQARAQLSTDQLLARFVAVGPRAAKARRRIPGLVRRRTMPGEQLVGGRLESWTIGFLTDTILTRDPWMHRIDICRATGRPPTLTADHDGVLVADVATEWAGRHGQACRLHLTGPAGGAWTFGTEGPELELDAIEFCRVLSGRAAAGSLPDSNLLSTQVPF